MLGKDAKGTIDNDIQSIANTDIAEDKSVEAKEVVDTRSKSQKAVEKAKYQNASKMRARQNILAIFIRIQNNRYRETGRYPRKIILEYLGESKQQYS